MLSSFYDGSFFCEVIIIKTFSVILMIVGVIISLISLLIKFKPIEYEELKNEEDEEVYYDSNSDEEFKMLLQSVKSYVIIFGAIFIIIGIIVLIINL